MRSEKYGGYSDWVILTYEYVENVGQKEREVSDQVQGKRVFGIYFKDGIEQTATEMFRCSFSAALHAFNSVVGGLDVDRLIARHTRYEFV